MNDQSGRSRRQIIMGESAALFRTKGFRATSMRDIAESVGIEAASLYNHISSKQQLLEELLLQIAERFTSGMDDIYNSSLAPRKKIERLIGLHVRLTLDQPDSIALLTSEWVHLEEPARATFLARRDAYEKRFIEIIKASIAAGDITDIDPQIALFSILSTLRWLHSWCRKRTDINPHELEEMMILCLIDGLKK